MADYTEIAEFSRQDAVEQIADAEAFVLAVAGSPSIFQNDGPMLVQFARLNEMPIEERDHSGMFAAIESVDCKKSSRRLEDRVIRSTNGIGVVVISQEIVR